MKFLQKPINMKVWQIGVLYIAAFNGDRAITSIVNVRLAILHSIVAIIAVVLLWVTRKSIKVGDSHAKLSPR